MMSLFSVFLLLLCACVVCCVLCTSVKTYYREGDQARSRDYSASYEDTAGNESVMTDAFRSAENVTHLRSA